MIDPLVLLRFDHGEAGEETIHRCPVCGWETIDGQCMGDCIPPRQVPEQKEQNAAYWRKYRRLNLEAMRAYQRKHWHRRKRGGQA